MAEHISARSMAKYKLYNTAGYPKHKGGFRKHVCSKGGVLRLVYESVQGRGHSTESVSTLV